MVGVPIWNALQRSCYIGSLIYFKIDVSLRNRSTVRKFEKSGTIIGPHG